MKQQDAQYEIIKEIYWRENTNSNRLPLAAGSGLLNVASGLWIVADDLHHLVFLPKDSQEGVGYRIFPGELPDDKEARKKVKPDSEAILDLSPESREKEIVVIPSGSKSNRTRGKFLRLDQQGQIVKQLDIDFTDLMRGLEEQITELNIEGGIKLNDKIVLLQRGNGKLGQNGLIKMKAEIFASKLKQGSGPNAESAAYVPVNAGEWDGVRLTFTDGFSYKGRLFYSAAAEASESTYSDGEVIGSSIGFIDREGRAIELARLPLVKIEGIAVESESSGILQIYAVTDADDSEMPSALMRVKLPFED